MHTSENLHTSITQHAGGSSNNASIGTLPARMDAVEIEAQLHEPPAFPSKTSISIEAHQLVDIAGRDMPEINRNKQGSSPSEFADETASPMVTQAQEATVGDDRTSHPVVTNSVESQKHGNQSCHEEAGMLVEPGGEDESMEIDGAEGASYFDIVNDQKDGEFFLYLLVSPSPKTVRASANDGHKSEFTQDFQPLKLPERARSFVGNYACWRCRFPLSFSRVSFRVIVTFPKAKLLGSIPYPRSKESTLFKYFKCRRRRLQIEFFHKQDPESREQMNLALNSVLVLLSNPLVLSDCFAECARMFQCYRMSDSDLNRACDWLAWIQQEFQEPVSTEGSNIEWASKMVPALLGQCHLVKHLQKMLPLSAATTMQQFVADLVHLTPASQWSLFLSALCNADPLYSFLNRWKARWGNIRMGKDQQEMDYEEAISNIFSFCHTFSDEAFKLKAIRAAILATPSGATLLRAIHFLLCSNVLTDLATVEEVEGFLSTDYGKALINHFKWLVEVETPNIMVKLLLRELSSNDSKILRTFIRILSTIFLRWQIFPLTKGVSGEINSPKASFDDLIKVCACQHTFTVPLLSDETILMYDIVSKGDLEFAARVVLALVRKVESVESAEGKGGIWDNLRTWLHKVCARAADATKKIMIQAPMTPHALYSKVANLFGKGLQSAGFLAEAIDEIVSRLLQQRCGLQEVIQDAGEMSFFDCNEIAQQYCSFGKKALSKHLNFYEQVSNKGLDHRATELLNWLCTRAKGDILLNGWIQEDLCTFLLDVLTNIGATNPSACTGTLVESNFKRLLLQVKLVPASRLQLHTFYQSLLREWTTLQKELEDQSISVGMISKLMNHPLASWEYVCKVQKVGSKTLTEAVAEVTRYRNTLLKAFHMLLDYAISVMGPRFTSRDIHEAQLWLEERNNKCKYFTLREIKGPKHWPSQLDAHFFEAMLILRRSKLLENIFKIKAPQFTPMCSRSTNEEETADEDGHADSMSMLFSDKEEIVDSGDIGDDVSWLWQNVASIMEVSLDCYVAEWKNLSNSCYPARQLSDFLCGLTVEDIEVEGNLAESFLTCWQEHVPQNFPEILAALIAWVNLQEKSSLVAALLKVERMFNIVEDGSELSATLQRLCDACIIGTLGEYLELYNDNLEAINYFSSKETVVIKQIADSEQLISFLKEKSGDDFRLLTDAIEEQAEDVLVDEATVSDLIHIDKVFRPLLKSERASLAHLKAALELETQSFESGQLCSKLSFCTINIHRIRQFVTSLADRSSVLRMNMHWILQSSVYDVAVVSQSGVGHCHEVCSFSLKINYLAASDSKQNSRQQFGLSELVDLRSRARMLLSRRRIQPDTCNQESTPPSALEDFVEFINLVEKFYNQVSLAHNSGHLLFDAFKWSGSGICCLQEKVRWMDGQLSCWTAALNRARLQFNCLNFFKGIELRLIHHCFSSKAPRDQIQLCYELLNFVKPGLDRNKVENYLKSCACGTETKNCSISEEGNETQMYECLQHLSTRMQQLFAYLTPGIIKETAIPEKIEDSTLLISVEEQLLEFNVVVEIFSKRGKHIRSQNNNLILCSSLTSWEEVHLLLLRYLRSDDNDGSQVFVISFIEKLSFECQLQLALELQQMAVSHHQGVKNQLVLVCWIGSQALQGISHHLKVPIQFMNGYAKDTIKHHLPEECTHMSVVTSELAGMGKSSRIKAHGLCATITISREVTLESFIMKLKNTQIGAEDSLHIDITTEEGYESLNCYLFELLILGVLKSSYAGAFWLAANKIYIELANTLGNSLETNLPVCSWLPHEHRIWELESLHISEDLESDEQVVCLYLDALALKQLDNKDIVLSGRSSNVLPLPEWRCKELLNQYLIKDSCQMSYSVLVGFLRTLAYQLRKLSATDFYTVETLCWILRSPTPGDFRSNLVASLVQAAKELSLRSVKPWLHGEQQQVLKKDLNTSMHMRMSSLLGWSESNHVMLFFDMYGPATVLYRDKKLIPEAMKSMMMIQAEVMGTELLDYSRLSSLELWRILSPILGSGKTLALQIIYSNLRGADSKDVYFQQLPRMLMLSYQGSQNSTSEGILRVFEKAKRYVESNRKRDMLVVIVLDEIALAETSCHNPLKVLHPLLEPDVQEIAVVGISNWSLDAAKMNRGIHLSQSDPEEEDLYDTGLAIFESYNAANCHQFREKLRGLVTAYVKYHAQQVRADFHGLRDFYSLIKSLHLCKSTLLEQEKLAHSLWRNFGGGSSADMQTFLSDVEELTSCEGLCSQAPPVTELIRSNLQDPEARHLLLITKGDSASSIIQHMLQQDDEFAIIRGSTYKDDKNEEYCYLLLGEIILHMEMGRCILLENADQVWSSLYDMLNQHYTIVGGRKNCRIALGVYSNPMCYVHDKFRCIVIVDHEHIPHMDPPFLNRFEKQILTYESILNSSQRRAVETIRAWAHKLAAISLVGCPDSTTNDAEREFFCGLFEDSVPSLVMYHWNMLKTEASNCSQLIHRCKVDLLQTANANAIARAHLQQNLEKEEFEHWTDMFLSWDAEQSLDELMKLHVSSSENWADSIGVKLIVTTFTPLQWSIHQDMESTAESSQIKVYCLRLGDFTSEKQLQTHINKFWTDGVNNLLVLQADDVSDRDHISLAKFHIDKARKTIPGETTAIKKHVLLIIHVQQGRRRLSRFSYLCGWKQLTIDRLQKEPIQLRVYLEKPISEILDHKAMPIKRIMLRVLTWCYLCIKYEDKTIPTSYPQKMVQLICQDEAVLASLKRRAMEWFLERKESLWQLTVLNNQKLLSTSASVHDAFVQYLEENFRECLARLLYLTEKTSSLSSYFRYDAHKQQVWRDLLLMPRFLNYDLAPPPCYPEGYTLEKPLDVQIPFSSLYAAHVDTFKQPYMDNLSRQKTSDLNYYDSGTRKPSSIQRDVDASLTPALAMIKTCIDNDLESYVIDFCNLLNHENLQTKTQALEWALRENLLPDIYHASDIHIVFWEREKEIKDQAALVSLCLATDVIYQHVRELRAGRHPNRSFKEDLALQCCLSLLPTEACLNEVGGIEGWIAKVRVLLKCVLPVGGPDIVFFLQTMHDFAVYVILPLHLHTEHLNSLVAWFIEDCKELCTSSLVRKVVAALPNLRALSNQQECRCWTNFLCSMLKRHPHLPSLSQNDLRIIIFNLLTSVSPSCMMGHVLFQLLNSVFSSSTNLLKGQNTIFKALFLNNGKDLQNEDTEDEINLRSSLFLVDFVYHKLRETMIPVLMNKEQNQEWDLENFHKCLSLALQACEDEVPLSLKKVMALAFMKCFLYSIASLLKEVYLNRLRSKGYCQSVYSALLMISPDLRNTLQVFFMKILHWEFGLSADEIANILISHEKESNVDTFSFLLDSSLLQNVHNRLGFNPFMNSAHSFMTAELALKKLVLSSNGEECTGFFKHRDEEMMEFFRSAGQNEQAAFVAAIASHFFVTKSGGPLTDAESNAMKQVQELVGNLSNWDPLAKTSLWYLTANTPGGVWHCCEHLATNILRSRCLVLDVLVTVMNMPMESPLRGYCMLNASHLTGAHVLTELDNTLQDVAGLGSYREYLCGCGYMYIIGDCTRPAAVGTCPKCHKTIGGYDHALQPGNTALRDVSSQRVMETSLAGKAAFSVRINPLSYRLLRILVHYCFLIGITIGRDTMILSSYLNSPNSKQILAQMLTDLVEADMDLLDKLIACQREMTYQFIHSALRKLPQVYLVGPLVTTHQRDEWELAFEKVVNSQPPHESVSEYLQQKRTDGLNEVLQERDPFPPAALQGYFRMTKKPCFSHYGTMFVQNTVRAAKFPCVAAVLAHAKHLISLPSLLPIVEFSAVLHTVFGHKITRQEAATTTIQDVLWDKSLCSDAAEKYDGFEASWNSVRLLVKGYECHQFKNPIPAMHKAQPIGLCLTEKKDQGMYLIAILEFLRTCQNGFLDDVKAGLLEDSSAGHQSFDAVDARNMTSVRVQDCKAEQVVCFDEQWANDLVNELGMCNPAYGKGMQVEYDDYQIEMEMRCRLLQQKAFLEGNTLSFHISKKPFTGMQHY
ncbi:hypothetical protein GOP47_0028354 [Adiantum capillus-veneris]|nr:hypothetical protein GOP47_0028354 [Adiantum capillus-veneris]